MKTITSDLERRIYSQNGEDGIVEYIFNTIGTTNKLAVEIGVSGTEGGTENNTRALSDLGWSLIWFDCIACTEVPDNCKFVKAFITADNVVDEFIREKVPLMFDLLSIDIDGNDYHVRKALSSYKPRVCILEYNGY